MTIRFYHNFSSPKIEKIFQCDDMLCVFRFNIPFRHIVLNVFGNRFISAESRIMRSKYLDCWFYSCGVAARHDATESKPTIRQYNIIYNHNPRHHSPQRNIQKNGVKILKQVQDDRLRFFIEYLYIIYPERASWYPLQLHIPRRW